jgi:hypothetical protein
MGVSRYRDQYFWKRMDYLSETGNPRRDYTGKRDYMPLLMTA